MPAQRSSVAYYPPSFEESTSTRRTVNDERRLPALRESTGTELYEKFVEFYAYHHHSS